MGVMQKLRKEDRAKVIAVLNMDAQALTNEEAMERFYNEVSTPLQGVCQSMKRLGGRWWSHWKAVDGDKFVCLDSFDPNDCLVYTFGISNDWSFEDTMARLNCARPRSKRRLSIQAWGSSFLPQGGCGGKKGFEVGHPAQPAQ